MRLLLVRHGLTDWNIQNRFQGQTDIPLNQPGIQQAQTLGRRLAKDAINHIYTSDLERARQTAAQIAAHHTCPLHVDPALREIHFGEWEGLTYPQIQAGHHQRFAEWWSNLLEIPAPRGESLTQLAGRIRSFLDRLVAQHQGQDILMVAHGGPLQVLLCLALNIPLDKFWQFHISAASISVVRFYSDGAILSQLNDTCHLELPFHEAGADAQD
jgi:alpha-ribazole phosphatase